MAAHDLQEPLRKIRAFGGRLRSAAADSLDEQGLDYLARMEDAATRMQGLIDDLLTYARLAASPPSPETVDLTRIAREVAKEMEIPEGGAVEVEDLPTVEADPAQMQRLFENLIGNALKYRQPEMPPEVRVRSLPGDRPGTCRLIVEDNGIGFDQQYLEKVFTAFERLHPRSEYQGTGIGLAICATIAERHGGTITAQSTPGEGSTFEVTLPLEQPEV